MPAIALSVFPPQFLSHFFPISFPFFSFFFLKPRLGKDQKQTGCFRLLSGKGPPL